jgi:hypothetical protein
MDRDEVIALIANVSEQQQQAIVWALLAVIPAADRARVLVRIEAGAQKLEQERRPVGAQLLRSLALQLRAAEKK